MLCRITCDTKDSLRHHVHLHRETNALYATTTCDKWKAQQGGSTRPASHHIHSSRMSISFALFPLLSRCLRFSSGLHNRLSQASFFSIHIFYCCSGQITVEKFFSRERRNPQKLKIFHLLVLSRILRFIFIFLIKTG